MEITIRYIISQIFTVMGYTLVTSTYHMKKRKTVLVLNLLSKFAFAIAYVLLGAWSALAMIGVALIRNTIFMINENEKRKEINKIDILVLIIVYAISIISAIFTYEGFFSLLPVISTLIYTYAIFQKDVKTYKLLGIPTELCCEVYNFYIKSISAIFLELIPLTSSIIGYINEVQKEKQNS